MTQITWDYEYLQERGIDFYRQGKFKKALEQFVLALETKEAPFIFLDLHKWIYKSSLLHKAIEQNHVDYFMSKGYYEEAYEMLKELSGRTLHHKVHRRLKQCKGLALTSFKKGKRFGVKTQLGDEVIPPIYDELNLPNVFQCGRASVKKGGLWGLIDRKNNLICDFSFDSIYCTVEGYTTVFKDDKYNLVTPEGNLLSDIWYEFVAPRFTDGLLIVEQGKKYGFLNRDGEVVIPIEYERVAFFSEGYGMIQKNKKKQVDH